MEPIKLEAFTPIFQKLGDSRDKQEEFAQKFLHATPKIQHVMLSDLMDRVKESKLPIDESIMALYVQLYPDMATMAAEVKDGNVALKDVPKQYFANMESTLEKDVTRRLDRAELKEMLDLVKENEDWAPGPNTTHYLIREFDEETVGFVFDPARKNHLTLTGEALLLARPNYLLEHSNSFAHHAARFFGGQASWVDLAKEGFESEKKKYGVADEGSMQDQVRLLNEKKDKALKITWMSLGKKRQTDLVTIRAQLANPAFLQSISRAAVTFKTVEDAKSALDFLNHIPSLEVLSLSIDGVDSAAQTEFFNHFKNVENLREFGIRYSDNEPPPYAISLIGQMKKLESLHVSALGGNVTFISNHKEDIAKSLTQLENLNDFLFNGILDGEQGLAVAELMGNMPRLVTLCLANKARSIGANSQDALIQALSKQKNLQKLGLILTDFTGDRAVSVVKAMGQLSELEQVTFQQCHLNDDDLSSILKGISEVENLKELYFEANDFTGGDLPKILEPIQNSSTLELVRIEVPEISEVDKIAIGETFGEIVDIGYRGIVPPTFPNSESKLWR